MTNVRSGHQFERDIAKLLRDNGFDVVRAAASKGRLAGFDCDVIATKLTPGTKFEIGIAFFQMKRSKRK